MPKKQKLKLNSLEIESFKTSKENNLQGGISRDLCGSFILCRSRWPVHCPPETVEGTICLCTRHYGCATEPDCL